MEILNGIELSEKLLAELKPAVDSFALKPRLDIVFIGQNEASQVYVNKKIAAGEFLGIKVVVHSFLKSTTEEILELVKALANDSEVHGIIIQLPAPDIDTEKIFPLIPVEKDVDGLNPKTLGNIYHGDLSIVPATVRGIIYVFEHIAQKQNLSLKDFLSGKNVLIANRSLIIGKPLMGVLNKYNVTCTMAHSKTENINDFVGAADIIVLGTGSKVELDYSLFKKSVVLIDAGFNKKGKKIEGDVSAEKLNQNVAFLSPVPNGIGPLGVAFLLINTFEAFKKLS